MTDFEFAAIEGVDEIDRYWLLSFRHENGRAGTMFYRKPAFVKLYEAATGRSFHPDAKCGEQELLAHLSSFRLKLWHEGGKGYAALERR